MCGGYEDFAYTRYSLSLSCSKRGSKVVQHTSVVQVETCRTDLETIRVGDGWAYSHIYMYLTKISTFPQMPCTLVNHSSRWSHVDEPLNLSKRTFLLDLQLETPGSGLPAIPSIRKSTFIPIAAFTLPRTLYID